MPTSSTPSRAAPTRRLSVDHLEAGAAVQVLLVAGMRVGEAPIREPHRHDYHELIWVREGRGRHLIDGEPVPLVPQSVTVIRRGQVHQFAQADGVHGAVVRFTEAAMAAGGGRILAGPLAAGLSGASVPVPEGATARLEATIEALHAESVRAPDAYAPDLCHHLLASILLWTARWHTGSTLLPQAVEEADAQLHRRFAALLERDYARRHAAGHYADALGVPGPALSRALVRVAGRSTKELITERVMLEATRLLRFTDLTIGEVAYRVGFGDPLYFSRAFKRYAGRAPQSYRDAVRGQAGQAD